MAPPEASAVPSEKLDTGSARSLTASDGLTTGRTGSFDSAAPEVTSARPLTRDPRVPPLVLGKPQVAGATPGGNARLEAVDLLRGVACVLMVCGHVHMYLVCAPGRGLALVALRSLPHRGCEAGERW